MDLKKRPGYKKTGKIPGFPSEKRDEKSNRFYSKKIRQSVF